MSSRSIAVFAERAGRPVVMGRRWAIASGHPVASWAGTCILERGGSAIDAAVAIAVALNVVEPHMSGLGGDLFALVVDTRTGEVWAIDGTGLVPLEATPDRLHHGVPADGPLSIAVPGAARAWELLHARWGRLPLHELLAPAIELAADGFPVSQNLAAYLAAHRDRLSRYEATARTFLPQGRLPQPGDVLRQPTLARTLETLATTGFSALYQGQLAERLVRAVRQAGGLLSTESLARARAELVQPLQHSYRGWTVWTPPLNSGGHALLLALGILEHFSVTEWKPLSADLLHVMIEATKLADAACQRWAAGTHLAAPALVELFDPVRVRELAQAIDLRRAKPHHASGAREPAATTAFTVVDRDGLGIVVTATLHEVFGSGFVAGDTGLLLNNALAARTLDPQALERLEAGAPVRQTSIPIVVRSKERLIGLGSSGGSAQPQILVHVLVHLLEFGFSPQEAVELPRWRYRTAGRAAQRLAETGGLVDVEGRLPNVTIEGLQARRHRVQRLPRWGPIGSCQLVVRRDDGGVVLEAAADPRSEAYALAR